jgi:hypothetical protein
MSYLIQVSMIIEGVTIAGIIGSCGLLAWYAKKKFQPEIERTIEEQKKQENKLCPDITKIRKQYLSKNHRDK